MNRETTSVLQKQMGQSESLLWSGRPRQGLILKGSDVFLVPFSLMWGAFAIFWEYSVIAQGAQLFFLLFGGVFVLIGLYMIIGRFVYDSWVRSGTYYGLSNQRVLILKTRPTTSTRSLNLRGLVEISLKEMANGRGTVTFGSPNPLQGLMGMQWPGMGDSTPAFEGIDNAKSVYDQINGAQRSAT